MLLSDEKIKEIILKKELQDLEMLEVIQSYLYEKTGQNIYLKQPMNLVNTQLMLIAFDKATEFYLKKYEE